MAARGLTASMLAAIQAASFSPILLFEAHFDNGAGADQVVNLWTGIGSLSWSAKTWVGGGGLLMEISPIGEAAEVRAIGFQVVLSGLPTTEVALALVNARKNKDGYLWLGGLDSSGAVIADPYLLMHGRLDTVALEDSGDTARLTLRYEDRLVALQQPRLRIWDDQDQKVRSPTDTAGRHIAALQDASFTLE